MGYLEWLRNESEFHKVLPHTGGFAIQPSNDSEACLEQFHRIVEDAASNASIEGYEMLPHRSSRDSKGRWDLAVITMPNE